MTRGGFIIVEGVELLRHGDNDCCVCSVTMPQLAAARKRRTINYI